MFADFFTERELSLTLNWRSPGEELAFQTLDFQQWDFFFFFAFLIGLYSIHRLAMVKEVGEVEEKIVINELISEVRREMRNFSTVGGLRHMIQFPLSLIKPHKRKLNCDHHNKSTLSSTHNIIYLKFYMSFMVLGKD